MCQTTHLLTVHLDLGEDGVVWHEEKRLESSKRVPSIVAAFYDDLRWNFVG